MGRENDPESRTELETLNEQLSELQAELDRVKAEGQLAWAVLEHSPICVQAYDREGYSVFMNRAQERFLRVPDRTDGYGEFNVLRDEGMELLGSPALYERAYKGEVVTPPDRKIDLAAFDVRWDTSTREGYIRQLICPVRSADGTVDYVVSYHWDVTRVRAAESALATMDRYEKLAVLAGGIAHDFNNLLMSILANAELALAEPQQDTESLLDIQTAALQAADLTGQLLAYAGRTNPSAKAVHLSDLVAQMVRLVEAAMPKTIQFLLTSPSREDVVQADVSQLRQVVLNLLTNAGQALGEAPGIVRVCTDVTDLSTDDLAKMVGTPELAPGRYVTLTVADEGHGIQPEEISSIFDPFYSTREGGQGLGLATTLGIVKAHHGAIEVKSTPGLGTTMRVFLPAGESPPETIVTDTPSTAAKTGEATIVVVDDEPLVRRAARRALEKCGYTVYVARDGADGLRQLEKLAEDEVPVDLVLLDVSMPVMGGHAALRAIRDLDREYKVILMSGRENLDQSSPTTLLRKPFTLDELLATVASELSENAGAQ